MRTRPAVILLVAALLAALLGGCGSDGSPYDALSAEAWQYVIPGSEDWTSGELCPDGGSCSGPITVSVIESYDWYRIADIAIPGDTSTTDGTVTASLSVVEARSGTDPGGETVQVRVWGPDVSDVRGVPVDGFEVWAGVDSRNDDYAAVFAAFDDDGRVAGIGNAAAEYFTISVAELAAEAEAQSAFLYLDPIMRK